MRASEAQYTNRLLRLQVALRKRGAARTMGSNAHCRVTIQVHSGMHSSSFLARLNGRLYPSASWGSGEGKGERRTGGKNKQINGQVDIWTETDAERHTTDLKARLNYIDIYVITLRFSPLQIRHVSTGLHCKSDSPTATSSEFPAYRRVACVRFWSQRISQTIILHKPVTKIKNEEKGNKKFWEE
jgi:hypothetical protein